MVAATKSNLHTRKSSTKGRKSKKTQSYKRLDTKKYLNYLTTLKTLNSPEYLSLSTSQKTEFDNLQATIQKKDKFSLRGRNTQVIKIQNLTNTNLFLTSPMTSSKVTFTYRTNKKLLEALKAKRVTFNGTKQLARKKLAFVKSKFTKTRQNSSLKALFKNSTNTK